MQNIPQLWRLCLISSNLLLSFTFNSPKPLNTEGDFYIGNLVDDGDVIFQCDNGSGGNASQSEIDTYKAAYAFIDISAVSTVSGSRGGIGTRVGSALGWIGIVISF